jgi:hypothetical protein
VLHLVAEVMQEGEKAAAQNLDISLEDLIWLPNKWNVKVPQKAFLLWDEAQDANAAMLGLCLKAVEDGGRLIAIGDRRQAIMGFSGSDSNSWNRIHEVTRPTVLPLSLCYRCPTSHIELAQQIVPQIEARDDAPDGTIEVISRKQAKELVLEGDLVISRFTAPLVSLCLQLVIGGEKARVRGRDLGTDLTELVKRAVAAGDYPNRFHAALNAYCLPKVVFLKEAGEDRAVESLVDRLEAIRACFGAFGLDCGSLEQFCDRVENLFSDEDGAIILSTIHRAKGDESNRVFILGSNFLPFLCKADQQWQIDQEWNLTYVVLTRAKRDLYLIPLSKKDKSAEEYLNSSLGGLRLPSSTPVSVLSELKAGDRAIWQDCPLSLQTFNPFTIRRVQGDEIWLDWIHHSVGRTRLIWDSEND